MKVRFTKLNEFAKMPYRGSDQAAGYDLFVAADQPQTLAPGETKLMHIGISLEIPEGYFGGIYARSGLSVKEGLRPANCVGVIDSDYRGELMVALHNDSDLTRTIEPGQKVAQLVIQPYLAVEFEEAEALENTERGAGGFGSTGKQ